MQLSQSNSYTARKIWTQTLSILGQVARHFDSVDNNNGWNRIIVYL